MKIFNEVNKIVFGGDYNPEQWPREIWKEDMRLFKLANIDTVTINVFSWARIQKDDNAYDFSELDDIIEMAVDNDLNIILATSTAAHPAWMAKKYPEVTRVDFHGRKRKFGARHNSCPSSPIYQKFSKELAGKLAERYSDNKNIIGWHINNEYGGECYCENCEKEFRNWLKDRYGTIEKVNEAWAANFWSHTFYDFDEIVLPNILSEHSDINSTAFQGISLSYKRFMSDAILKNYTDERDAIRAFDTTTPITTNFMYNFKGLDYQKWAKELDFISWDNYPTYKSDYTYMSFNHDLFRSLKNGNPFIIMEQTPSGTNWKPVNPIARPNVMRLNSYQGVAHGSDGVLFFQLRKSRGATEKFHGAVIDHSGTEFTRVFKEVSTLGEELVKIGDELLGGKVKSKVGIIFNWDNWWALDYSSGPTYRVNYVEEVMNYYRAFSHENIPVDILSVDDNFDNYDLIVAPALYMVKNGLDEKIRAFVKNGGDFLTTTLSGIVDENDLVHLGGYPATLRDVIGIWVEEIDDLPKGFTNEFSFGNSLYPAINVCDVIHNEGSESMGEFHKDFYKNKSAITCNKFGNGRAYYVGTTSSAEFYKDIINYVASEKGISSILKTENNIEATIRENENGKFLFILNHNDFDVSVTSEYEGVSILDNDKIKKSDLITLEPWGLNIYKLI